MTFGERGLPAASVPGIDGPLASEDRRTRMHAIVDDREQVGAILGGQGAQARVLAHQDRGFPDPLGQPHVAAVAVRDARIPKERRNAPKERREPLTAEVLRKRAGEPSLARPGGPVIS